MRAKLTAEDLEDLALRARIAELAAKQTWLTVCEAACYGNFGESTLWKHIGDGSIPSSKDGGNVRLKRVDIDAYWAKRTRGSCTAEACAN